MQSDPSDVAEIGLQVDFWSAYKINIRVFDLGPQLAQCDLNAVNLSAQTSKYWYVKRLIVSD